MSEVLNQNMLYELKIFSKDIIDKSFYIGERPYEIFDRICLISERLSESLNLSKGKTISLKNKIINLLLKKIKIEDIYYNFMKIMKLDSNLFNWDNIPTYAFIKICCLGFEKDSSIKHIVIDEMQDYDSVSFFVIKMLYKNATLTILGDYNQNLMCNESNLSCIEKIFSNLKLVELKTSYRSSSNIIEFANSILKKNIAKNHFRKGKVPVITESKNEQDMLKKINYQIEISIKNNQKLAILVKTKEQATKLQKKLTNGTLIVSDTNSVQIENMVIISTIFLCKGLEFDNVIIPYLTEENYKTTIDKYNLYVAITRALHSVEGFHYQNPSPLIDKKYINFLKS